MHKRLFEWIEDIPDGSRLAIYGAGAVGRELMDYLCKEGRHSIVAWVDAGYELMHSMQEWPIMSPGKLRDICFDYIVIAVSKREYISEITDYLYSMGIPNWKIIAANKEFPVYNQLPQQMKTIALLDTGVATFNMGDSIIMNSIRKEMDYLLKNYFVVNFSTHVPIADINQQNDNFRYIFLKKARYSFCCGTDLLQESMDVRIPQWNIGKENSDVLSNVVLLGVGSSLNNVNDHFDEYTAELLRKVLSTDIVHSVRDEKSKEMLAEIGIQAVNTGCPTLWRMNSTFCDLIPRKKSEMVVFSISEAQKDTEKDLKLIEILRDNYKKLFFWPQTLMDYNYIKRVTQYISDICLIKPNIEAFSQFLSKHSVDYVGTRLHGGIFAMQHAKRSLILGIDARARRMYRENNINYVQYGNWSDLHEKINSEFATDIILPKKEIEFFKSQFK